MDALQTYGTTRSQEIYNTKYDYRTDYETSPLTEHEKNLINQYFKACYQDKVADYIERSPISKKQALIDALEAVTGGRAYTAPTFQTDVAFTHKGGFGLSYNFLGKRSSRKVNPQRFASQGIKDNGIFGYPHIESQVNKMIAKAQIESSPYIHMIVSRFIKPDKMKQVLKIADEHSAVFKDLYREMSQNSRPHTSLSSPGPPIMSRDASGNSQIILVSPTTSLNKPSVTTSLYNSAPLNFSSLNMSTKPIIQNKPTIEEALQYNDNPSTNGTDQKSTRKGEYSVRLKDKSFRDVFKSDARWAPKLHVPKQNPTVIS